MVERQQPREERPLRVPHVLRPADEVAAGQEPGPEVERPRRADEDDRHRLAGDEQPAAGPQPGAGEEHREVAQEQEVREAVGEGVGRHVHGEEGRGRPPQPREAGRAQAPPRVIRNARACVAARCPLRTAPSIVAGRPVSVQSPARKRPAMRRVGPGPQRLDLGAGGEGREGVAQHERALDPRLRHRREVAAERPLRGGDELRVRLPRAAVGRAHDEGQVLGRPLAPVEPPLVEDPLHLARAQAQHGPVHDHAVEPHLDGDDRRAGEARERRRRAAARATPRAGATRGRGRGPRRRRRRPARPGPRAARPAATSSRVSARCA